MTKEKQYWRGFEERDKTLEYLQKAQTEFPDPPKKFSNGNGVTRRSFLKAAGFTIAGSVLAACSRGPVKKAIPYLNKPEEVTPGKAFWYASTCHGCGARCGVLVKNRDGRPIKLEGNPQHSVSQGGLCAVGQASVLELYDSHRISQPEIDGIPVTWNEADKKIRTAISENTGKTVLLTGTITSPTTRAVIEKFKAKYPNFSHIEFDPIPYDGILDAHQELYGERILSHYRFENANMILSLDADFLGTWISPVEYSKGYSKNRTPDPEHPEMSYHVQAESRMSLTGSNADLRIPLSPQEINRLTANLANTVAKKAERSTRFGNHELPIEKNQFNDLVTRLWERRGESLVVSGSNNSALQKAVAFINESLGNVGETVDLSGPSYQKRGSSEALQSLLTDMESGEVGTLFISGVNPVYDFPNGEDFRSALGKVGLTVGLNGQRDETMQVVTVHCPTPHFLEVWHDSEPVEGVLSITQPNIQKLGDTRSLRESLSVWMGTRADDHALIRDHWENEIHPRSNTLHDFQTFWDNAVHDGYVELNETFSSQPRLNTETLEPIPEIQDSSGMTLMAYQKTGMLDGSHAGNPWLQEMPDPVSKVTWDNYASIAPETSKRMNIKTGDILRVQTKRGAVELPALVQPGQHPSIIAIALGYGRNVTRRFHGIGPEWIQAKPTVQRGETVGERIAHLLPVGSNSASGVEIEKTGDSTELALTQTHHTLDIPEKFGGADRQMVRESTLSEFAEHPGHESEHLQEDLQLWPNDFEYDQGHHWGMAIDLNKCTGCSACLISCNAENNVPVVGKDEVRRRREMHWIRIDRYYSGSEENPDVSHQPMMCQHCDHAPCEPVCPVMATMHSEEGLNQQIYNRCVGTRYCANNCPYKVRRFNWFDYNHGDEVQRMMLNPDVTVRSRGVMEKCSLCVQRIQEKKNEAKANDTELQDGDIQLACQQSCPTDAIIFGDLNDPESKIAKAVENPRHYHILEKMNFRPTTGYLSMVRNRDSAEDGDSHA